jgi:hypothetical protein
VSLSPLTFQRKCPHALAISTFLDYIYERISS